MSFMGAGCKLMENAGLKEAWATVYKENSLPKMLEGKAYSRCLRACLMTDVALHCALLSVIKQSNETHDHPIFESVNTFDEKDKI